MRGWAIVAIVVLAFPAEAATARKQLKPPPPPDNTIQRLSDVAFVSGHAPAVGGVILGPDDPARPGLDAAMLRPVLLPDMSEAMTRPLQAAGDTGLRLGARVPVRTVGDFVQGKLKALGIKDGAVAYGDQGRFYLFAAVRGQAVGMNLVRGAGGLHRDGWSSDVASALVGDGQFGLGWRKGGLEADLGYVHRGVHIRNAPRGVSDSYADDMAAVSLTLRPHWSLYPH